MRKYRNLTKADRLKIETLINAGHKVSYIAAFLGVNRSTIYRELKRGEYEHTLTDLTTVKRYSADLGQDKHNWAVTSRGSDLRIGNDAELVQFLEYYICDLGYSPEAAVCAARKLLGRCVCVRTLYRYIDAGLFLRLSNKFLPVKGKKKKKKKVYRTGKRASAGRSIEHRPIEIDKRDTFGHWEMDTVKGKQGVTRSCLLVLTERLTRKEIIVKLPDQKAASVVAALDVIEKKFRRNFSCIFKTITVDNGVEFSDAAGIERSKVYPGKKRTDVYYCHAYSSWERGSNENANKMIRRHIPKGFDIDKVSNEKITYIEQWINNYPRKILGYETSEGVYLEFLKEIV